MIKESIGRGTYLNPTLVYDSIPEHAGAQA